MAFKQHSSARWLAHLSVTVLVGLAGSTATAQTAAEPPVNATPGMVTDPAPAHVDVGLSTTSLTVPEDLWARLDEAENRSRKVRIALIAGAGAFVVGGILAAVWTGQNCTSSDRQSTCRTEAQPGLAGTTAFFVASGAITMITTGIMLGVRNRQKRLVLDEIKQYRPSRAHWDAEAGVLRF